MKTGHVNLPLHYGKAPRWLFSRMAKLAREISIFVVSEFGTEEMLKKLSDPLWFQAFGCVLGFDWHSSGLTSTTCGALKEGLKDIEKDLGFYVCGGKGRTSRKTPSEIKYKSLSFADDLVYASKMSAKVDNSAIQDGYQLYQHTFFFTKSGSWSVVQQGMNELNRYARRYHWYCVSKQQTDDEKQNNRLVKNKSNNIYSSSEVEKFQQLESEKFSMESNDKNPKLLKGKDKKQDGKEFSFVCEPHSGVISQKTNKNTLNLVVKKGEKFRDVVAQISKEEVNKNIVHLEKIEKLDLPRRHPILNSDLNTKYLKKILLKTYENQPENFEKLLGVSGVGPKTIRALSLISELIYGEEPNFSDPARFSFTHGGKDGYPYPVNRQNYDKSIEILKKSLNKAKINHSEKVKAFKRLNSFYCPK